MGQTIALSLILSVALGCGTVRSDPDAMADDVADADPDDTVAPTLAQVSPASDSLVEEGFSFTLAFSEPMDTASVEGALSLPAAASSLQWNLEHTELTVGLDVSYPTGTDPSDVPLTSLDISIGTGATDKVGNALESPANVKYVLRYKRITATIPYDVDLSGNWLQSGGRGTWFATGERSTDDTTTNRGFATFSIAGLPSGIEIEQAELRSEIEAVIGDPFGKLGSVLIDDVIYDTIDSTAFAAPGTQLGTFIPTSPTPVAGAAVVLDITSVLADDYAHRAARNFRTQFRIRFPYDLYSDPLYTTKHSDGVSDLVRMVREKTNVVVTYLVH